MPLPYFFCYKTGILSLLTLSQSLDLSCKTDLDFWDSFRWRKFHLIPKFLLIKIFEDSVEMEKKKDLTTE